jgi:hypothetical protein
LDTIWKNNKSRAAFENWMANTGVDHICKVVGKEMESAKPLLQMDLKDVSPEFLEQWDVNTIMKPVTAATPTWSRILYAATEPQQKDAESRGGVRNRSTVRFSVFSDFSGVA